VLPGASTDPVALGDVTIVHDYLNQRGGAEKVVLELAEMWPAAPIYTSLYRPESTFPEFRSHDVRTTWLDRVPVDAGFRNLFPLYPAAFRSLGQLSGDVVIASSSGWAHMARVAPEALHVVYCYTPARWLYRSYNLASYGHRTIREAALRPGIGALRELDRRAANRADLYIAISHEVAERIRVAYGIDAAVVYPPVNTDRLTPRPRGERLLVITRLMPYKRVDLVVRGAMQLGIGLDVVGEGPVFDELRGIAGPNVAFHGSASDATVIELLESCAAVCVAGEEDFGMVAVEAQAAGKPVVAFGRGGALETVEDGVTGVLFGDQSVGSFVAAVKACQKLATSPELIAARAERFSIGAFRTNLVGAITARMQDVV
jgi:glycosyltransferase involved in cell wall biosynthesis